MKIITRIENWLLSLMAKAIDEDRAEQQRLEVRRNIHRLVDDFFNEIHGKLINGHLIKSYAFVNVEYEKNQITVNNETISMYSWNVEDWLKKEAKDWLNKTVCPKFNKKLYKTSSLQEK